MLFLLQEVRKDSRPVLGLLVLVLPLLLPFELESGQGSVDSVSILRYITTHLVYTTLQILHLIIEGGGGKVNIN